MDSDHLPSDMVFEILSRTRLETLNVCKAVSKEWKNMIYESNFMLTYLKRTNNIFGYIFQNLRSCKHVSTFVSIDPSEGEKGNCINGSFPFDDMRILASCNQGLLCCDCEKSGRNYRFYVGKPATRQWRALPNPKLRYRTAAVGIMVVKSKPLHFKIVRLSEFKSRKMRANVVSTTNEYYCEIFDSHIWAWRAVESINLAYEEMIASHQSAISVGSLFYCQTNKDSILSFDVANESFRKFSLPESLCNNDAYKYKRLLEYEGGLAFSCSSVEGNTELWQWRNNCRWTSNLMLNMSHLENGWRYPVGFHNSDMTVMKTYDKVVFYKFEEGSYTEVEINIDFSCCKEVFQFQSDLENVDFNGGI